MGNNNYYFRLWYTCSNIECNHMEWFINDDGKLLKNSEAICPKCGSYMGFIDKECRSRKQDSKLGITSRDNIPISQSQQVQSKPTVTCPYCKSTNTYKIHTSGKVLSAALFGIFALPGISKQWGCRDCKSEF